jgi:hypothetical protein
MISVYWRELVRAVARSRETGYGYESGTAGQGWGGQSIVGQPGWASAEL